MRTPIPTVRTLVTDDGVPIDAVHLPPRPGVAGAGQGAAGAAEATGTSGAAGPVAATGLAFVVAHGFSGSWQRPPMWRIANRLTRFGGVVCFDFRGHGRSGGKSTLGDRETRDLAVAVAWARELGYERIAAIGFSMGASVVLRYAGITAGAGGLAALVSVSGPGRWYYRGTMPMRRLHWAVEHRFGRLVARIFLNTRVHPGRWDPVPVPPAQAAAMITSVPLLVLHGDRDAYFPVDHAQQIFAAAAEPKELWIVPGYGHAESATSNGLADRIGAWVVKAATSGPSAVSPMIYNN
jgi:pimeloyl-ACP methyl ester carboxylesterase